MSARLLLRRAVLRRLGANRRRQSLAPSRRVNKAIALQLTFVHAVLVDYPRYVDPEAFHAARPSAL